MMEQETSVMENTFDKRIMPTTPGNGINSYNKSKTMMSNKKSRFTSTRPSDALSPSMMMPPSTAESVRRGNYATSPLSKHQGALNIV